MESAGGCGVEMGKVYLSIDICNKQWGLAVVQHWGQCRLQLSALTERRRGYWLQT